MPLSVDGCLLVVFCFCFFYYIQPSHGVLFLMLKVAARGSERQDKFTKCRRWDWPQGGTRRLGSMEKEAARQSSAIGHLLWLITMHVSTEAAEC